MQDKQRYILTIVSASITIILTFLPFAFQELRDAKFSYAIFSIGLTITVALTLLEQKILTHISKQINQKLKIYTEIEQIDDKELKGLALNEVSKCLRKIESYKRGYAKLPGHVAIEDGLIKTQNTFKATSWAFYAGDFGKKVIETSAWKNYYDRNITALKRGVKIDRLVILSKEKLDSKEGIINDSDLVDLLVKQVKDGINIRISWIEDWELTSDKKSLKKDFGIFDSKQVIETQFGVTGEIVGSTLIKNKDEVQEYCKIFERLWNSGINLDKIIELKTDS